MAIFAIGMFFCGIYTILNVLVGVVFVCASKMAI